MKSTEKADGKLLVTESRSYAINTQGTSQLGWAAGESMAGRTARPFRSVQVGETLGVQNVECFARPAAQIEQTRGPREIERPQAPQLVLVPRGTACDEFLAAISVMPMGGLADGLLVPV